MVMYTYRILSNHLLSVVTWIVHVLTAMMEGPNGPVFADTFQ